MIPLLKLLLLAACLWDDSETAWAAEATSSLGALADLPLEALPQIQIEMVSAPSGFAQAENRAPAAVSIVTADEIKKFGYRTLAEILASIPGLYAIDDLNYTYLGVRGFNRPGDYNSRVLLLVDGHRINDNIYGQGLIGTESILDVDLIERVEFIRGPASSLYGDNAFLGVINVTTRTARALDGGEASFAAGGFDSYKGRLSYGHRFTNGLELAMSGSWYDSGGAASLYFPAYNTPATHRGIAENSDTDRSQSLFGSLHWHDLTLSAAFSNREKYVPTASFGTVFNSGMEKTTDLGAFLDLKLEHDLAADTRLLGRVYYDLSSYVGHYPYYATNSALPQPVYLVVNGDDSLGQSVGTEWRLTQKLFDRHTLVAGVEYRNNFEQFQQSFYYQPGFPDIRIEKSSFYASAFAEAEVCLLTNLTFNGGLRYDHYSTFGDTANPRVGLIYAPWPGSDFKLLYGQAFRAPTVFELFYYDPGANAANPHLSPERIQSYDLVYEQALPARLRFTAGGYYYEIRDLISQQTDALDQSYFRNLGGANSKGVELGLDHRSASGLLARASYTLQRTEDTATHEILSNSPRNLAKLGLVVPCYRDRIFASAQVLFTDSVRTLSGGRAESFAVVNLTLYSRELVKGLEASAGIYNLFDTHYGFPGSADHLEDTIPARGRDFRVKLTYHF